MSFAYSQLGYSSRAAFERAFPGERFYPGFSESLDANKGPVDDYGYGWVGNIRGQGKDPQTGVYAPSDVGKYIGGNKPVYTKIVPYMDPSGTLDPSGIGASGVFTSEKVGGTQFVQTATAVFAPPPTPPANFIPPRSVWVPNIITPSPITPNPVSSNPPGLNANRVVADVTTTTAQANTAMPSQRPTVQRLPANATVATVPKNYWLYILAAAAVALLLMKRK